MITATLFAWALAAAQQPVASPPIAPYQAVGSADPARPGAAETLALTPDSYDRMTVAVTIGEAGPFRFLVDTGSDRTVLSKDLAKRLSLRPQPAAVLNSATGSSIVPVAQVLALRVGRKTVRTIDAPLLDSGDMGADGILGIDALRSQRLRFDFAARTLSIASDDEARTASGPNDIVVRARRAGGRLVITDATVDGQRVSVVIDTGSQLSVANRVLQRRMRDDGLGTPAGLLSVTGQTLVGDVSRIGSLRLGNAELRDVAVLFADAHVFSKLDLDDRPAMLLGMNALAAFDTVVIDFARKRVHFVLRNAAGIAERR